MLNLLVHKDLHENSNLGKEYKSFYFFKEPNREIISG